MHLSSERLWFEQIWLVVMNNHKHDGHLFCIHEVSGSKYLQLDIFCWKHKKTPCEVHLEFIHLQYLKFQQLMPEAELLRSLIAFLLHPHSTPHPSLLVFLPTIILCCAPEATNCTAVLKHLLSTLTERFGLWVKHIGKYKKLQSSPNKKRKKKVCGGGHRIKSSAYTSIYYMCVCCYCFCLGFTVWHQWL